MTDDQNPFADLAQPDATPEAKPVNPFEEFAEPDLPNETSATEAFGLHAGMSALPTAGSLAGAGAGATLGATLGAAAGPVAPIAAPVLGLAGGLAGGILGAETVAKAQNWALEALPDEWRDPLTQKMETARLEHPTASFIGGLAPFALAMRPGPLAGFPAVHEGATAIERLMANPVTARLFGGGIMGGLELVNEKAEGQPIDWTHVAIATGFGFIFNKPTGLGEKLTHAGERPVAAGLESLKRARGFTPDPTVAEARDLGVMGPGVTEDTFRGDLEPAAEAKFEAQEARRAEMEAPQPDLHALARKMEPEVFERYDSLAEQRDHLRAYIEGQRNPAEELIREAEEKRDAASAALGAHLEARGGYAGGPEARKMRAELRAAENDLAALEARRNAFAEGASEDTPEMSEARRHLMDIDYEMRDLGRQMAAAYRRAAEHGGGELVEPEVTGDVSFTPKEVISSTAEAKEKQASSSAPAETMAELPPVAPGFVRMYHGAKTGEQPGEGRWLTPSFDYARDWNRGEGPNHVWYVDIPESAPELQAWRETNEGVPRAGWTSPPHFEASAETMREAKRANAAETPAQISAKNPETGIPASEPAAPSIDEQRAFIVSDIARQMTAAGRSQEEAEHYGHVIAARYTLLSRQFQGKLGTPLELYKIEAADVLPGETGRGGPSAPRSPVVPRETEREPIFIGGKKVEGDFAEKLRSKIAGTIIADEAPELVPAEADLALAEPEPLFIGGQEIKGQLAAKLREKLAESKPAPLPEEPAAREAEVVRRSAAPEPEPETVLAEDERILEPLAAAEEIAAEAREEPLVEAVAEPTAIDAAIEAPKAEAEAPEPAKETAISDAERLGQLRARRETAEPGTPLRRDIDRDIAQIEAEARKTKKATPAPAAPEKPALRFTREGFLDAYAEALKEKFPWARDDAAKLNSFIEAARKVLKGGGGWEWNTDTVKAAWKKIGGKGKLSLKGLRELVGEAPEPVAEAPVERASPADQIRDRQLTGIIWSNGLTPFGRREVVTAAGLRAPVAKKSFHYLTNDEQARITAVLKERGDIEAAKVEVGAKSSETEPSVVSETPTALEPEAAAPTSEAAAPEAPAVEEQPHVAEAGAEPAGGGGGAGRPVEEIQPGTQDVSGGEQSGAAEKPKRIRKPRKLSAFGGGSGESNAPERAGEPQQQQGDAEPAVPAESGVVTKPPAITGGTDTLGPDLPAPARDGLTEATKRYVERTRKNYRITDEDGVGLGSPKEKIDANIEAMRVLKTIEEEGRDASPQEKAILVKYTGWGAFAQDMFSPYKKGFEKQREAFRALATDEEFEAARASTLNAHYTSPDVVRGMWDALSHLGYDGGLAIEPSSGVGHFIGLIPDHLADKTAWTAVELDPLTGRIAKALYGDAEVNIQGFETLKRPSNYYDLAISNVPFGNFNLKEKPYGAFPIHDFFFVKSLDKVRPGGVVAFITSRYTMDRLDAGTRRLLSKSADLVGAIRLPGGKQGAFAGNAGTQVTTDILFLRKRIPGEAEFPGAKWLETKEIETPDGPVKINEYFADNPSMMLGEMRLTGSMYSDKEPVLVGEPDGLREKIAEAARVMPEGAFLPRTTRAAPETVHANDIGLNVKEGAFFVKDGKVFRRINNAGEEHSVSAAAQDRLTRLVGIRDLVNDLLKTQVDGGPAAAEQAEHLRGKLRESYEDFVKKHGPINKEVKTVTTRLNKAGEPIVITKRPNLAEFALDPDGFKVAAIENYDPESGKATAAAIQSKDVISAPAERKINGPSDAVAAVLDAKGHVDLQEIGRMLNVETEEEVVARLGDLVYHNPDGRAWETADKYLSGDVVKKLEEARELAKTEPAYLRNVAALEQVQPTPLEPADITAQFGAPWIPEDDYVAFLTEIGGYNVKVRRVPVTGDFKVEASGFSRDAITKYGTDRVPPKEIIDAAINNRQVTVYDKDSEGKLHVNQEQTEQARVKIEALKEAFAGDQEAGIDGWAFTDPDRAERLAAIYNRTFNNLALRKFDGAHLTVPGMSADLTLRPHQTDAVWRVIQNGNTLFAHVVGAGKTYTMIAAGMEQRRLGLVNKPAYVVPNHMLEQFSREFLQAYPDAKILVAQKDEMSADARKNFVAKIAANDWDAVIITHDAFGRINMNRDFREKYVRDQLDELERIIEAEKMEAGGKAPTVKELEKAKKKLQTRLTDLLNEERKDEGVNFEETGIDHLFVDEAHKFKNLSFITRLQRVKGLSQGNSQRAEDLFLKIRYLEQKRPGRSAVFATGTPVSNTMAELWTMQRYLQLDKLKERGLDNFDAWASTFGRVVNNMELSADGRTFKEVSSFSKFVNVPELVSIYSEIADTKTADMLNLPRPEVKTRSGAPGVEIVQAEPSEQEEAHIEELVKLAESLKGKRPEPGQPNMLSVVTMGRKVATDGRLIDPDKFEFNPRGKIAKAIENISRIYKEGKDPATVQMVFLDMGVPSSKAKSKPSRKAVDVDEEAGIDPAQAEVARINLYDDIKQRLVEQGVPSNEIAFIHDATDDVKKAKLFARTRSGEVRVLLGSSEKMGVGTNVQTRLIAMHHLDAPWKPAEVEQRDGRIIRQGNLNPQVQIYRYITKRSFDAFMWQKLDTKSKFISQVLSGAKGQRHAEDVDNPLPEAAEMKAAASGDPRIMEHAELSRQVRQLASQKRVFDTTQQRATWELRAAESRVKQYNETIAAARADADRVADISGDKFTVTLGGKPVTERKAAGAEIIEKILARPMSDFYTPRAVKLGELAGFDMNLEVKYRYDGTEPYLAATPILTGDSRYSSPTAFALNSSTDPAGLIRRFENILASIKAQPRNIEAGLAAETKNIEKLGATLKAKWPREAEYAEAQAKLRELTQSLKAKDETPVEGAAAPEGAPAEEAPREFEQSAKGKISFAKGRKPIIYLFRDADASTIIHETGHKFLDELLRYSAHELAPPQLRDDATTVLDWLGARSAEDVKTKHHEKFARGFEQYMREGRAPSRELAGVFAKFREWLLQIYQTIKGLGSPINDDIRRVFDRMLAEEPQRTAIAPDRAREPTFADIHETDAALTEPHEAEAVADRIDAERLRAAQEPPETIAHEIAPALAEVEAERAAAAQGGAAEPAGETGGGAVGRGKVGDRGEEAGPVAGGGGMGAGPGAKRAGVNAAAPEGDRLRGGEPGAGKSPLDGLMPRRRETLIGAPNKQGALDNLLRELAGGDAEIESYVKGLMADTDDFVGERRGRITHSQIAEFVDAAGIPPEEILERNIGDAFNAEQMYAAWKFVKNLNEQIYQHGQAGDALAYERDRALRAAFIKQFVGARAEAGRTLGVFRRILKEMGQAGEESQEFFQLWREVTGRDFARSKVEAESLGKLESPEGVANFLQASENRTFGRMLFEYWINSIISGAVSQVTDIVGNTTSLLVKAGPETAAAALLGRGNERVRLGEIGASLKALPGALAPAVKAAAESVTTGSVVRLPGESAEAYSRFGTHAQGKGIGLDEAATWKDARAATFGALKGLEDAFRAMGPLLKGGVPGSKLAEPVYSDRGLIPNVAVRGAEISIGDFLRSPSRFLTAMDSFSRAVAYSVEKNALAYREAAKEGLTGAEFDQRVAQLAMHPTVEMMETAHKEARVGSLTIRGGKLTQALSHLANSAEVGGLPIGKFIVPFINITSIMMNEALMKRTPLGFLSKEIRADLSGANGPIAQQKAQARMLVGSTLALTAAGFAAKGLMTGSPPQDPRERAVWQAAGKQPYSVKIGDAWYSYKRLGVFGLHLGLAADLFEVAQTAVKSDEHSEAVGKLIHAIAQNVLDQSFLRGPSDLIRAFQDKNYGAYYVRNELVSFMPFSVGMGQAAQMVDPYTRETRTIVDAMLAKIPFASQRLRPRLDLWGNPVPTRDGLEIGWAVPTAIWVQRENTDPVNRELMRLQYFPSQPDRKIRGVKLTDEQYHEYARIAGHVAKENLDRVVNSERWATFPDHVKKDVMQTTIEKAREAARGYMMAKFRDIPLEAVKLKRGALEGTNHGK